jgi:uncharacterized protein (TIGR02466 family)
MHHQLHGIFHTPVFVFNIFESGIEDAEQLVDDIYENIKTEIMNDDGIIQQTNNEQLHKDSRYEKLVTYFESCLEEIRGWYNFDAEKFSLTQMWVNKTLKDGHHPVHYHPNAYLSGVFYFGEGGDICFKDPVDKRLSQIMVQNDLETLHFCHAPKKGLLLIFPSWLHHGTKNNHTDERWSLSFNSLPNGKTNYSTSSDLRYSRINITVH